MLDMLVAAYIGFRTLRAGGRELGRALHGLVSLSLLIALFRGLRLDARLRDLLKGIVAVADAAPGLGSGLLILLGAWYLMRLVRNHLGTILERFIALQWTIDDHLLYISCKWCNIHCY